MFNLSLHDLLFLLLDDLLLLLLAVIRCRDEHQQRHKSGDKGKEAFSLLKNGKSHQNGKPQQNDAG